MNSTVKQPIMKSAKKRPYAPLLVCSASAPRLFEGDAYGLAVTLDVFRKQDLQRVLPKLINGNSKFMLVLDAQLNTQETAVLDAIVTCMFSPNYLRENDNPVLGFIQAKEETEINSHQHVQTLLNYISGQGWPSVKCWNFTQDDEGLLQATNQQPLVVTAIETENEFSEKYLSDLNTLGEYILFHQTDPEKTVRLEQAFFTSVLEIIHQYPLLQKGLWDYVQEKQTASRLRAKNATLEEKLANAEKTISVIRTKYKDDYENLFKWYHNEYEILPLWYKRFGQLLKVLTGKRTFRSLFNDDVKKYKT